MKEIRITTQTFDGPPKKEVTTFDETYPMSSGGGPKLSVEQLEVKFSALLAQAAYAGFDVEISKVSDPTKGMGGHIPHLIIRPDYQAARAKMSETGASSVTVACAENERSVLFTIPSLEPARDE